MPRIKVYVEAVSAVAKEVKRANRLIAALAHPLHDFVNCDALVPASFSGDERVEAEFHVQP